MTYNELKERARQEAIDWQLNFANESHYMSELVEWVEHFNKLGKRYGLLKEFRENGII